MNACSWKPTPVTLHDGRQVLSDSEEWRHECEARFIIAMPTLEQRRQFLYGRRDPVMGELRGGLLQRRGQAAVTRIEQTIKAIWYGEQRTPRGTE